MVGLLIFSLACCGTYYGYRHYKNKRDLEDDPASKEEASKPQELKVKMDDEQRENQE